jgi:flagellar biosynthesis/type III secretory pathway chaperone
MGNNLDEKKLYYQRALIIWENFCDLHRQLYELTCNEYLTLLESDIENLEIMLPLKEEIIAKIGDLEKDRTDLIDTLNSTALMGFTVSRAGELLEAFAPIEQESGVPALKNLNTLLIDIIHKIQDQNKKNQMFLNKAMLSIRDIKQGFSGKKQYTTYGSDGQTRTLNR